MTTVIEGGAGASTAGAGDNGAGAGAGADTAAAGAGASDAGKAAGSDAGAGAGVADAAGAGAGAGADAKAADAKVAEGGGDKPDWRSQWAKLVEADKLDDKASEILKRFGGESDAVKALVNGQAKIQELTEGQKGLLKIPGADAKPEEIDAVYKALGRPEKAEDYKIYRPEGLVADAGTEANEKAAATALHKLGLNQSQVDGVLKDLYYPLTVQAAQAREANGQRVAQETKRTLTQDWGTDYNNNIAFAHQAAGKVLGPAFSDLRNVELADGTLLGDNLQFVKGFAQLGRDMADDGVLIVSESGPVGGNVDKRISEIRGLLKSGKPEDRKTYQTAEIQTELDKLTAIQNRRLERGSKP